MAPRSLPWIAIQQLKFAVGDVGLRHGSGHCQQRKLSSLVPVRMTNDHPFLTTQHRLCNLKRPDVSSLQGLQRMLTQDGEELSSLSNPLVSVDQLTTSSSQLDGIPPELESSLRYAGARLIQTAGILLRVPQETTVQAIVLFYRFYVGPEGGSFWVNSLTVSRYKSCPGG